MHITKMVQILLRNRCMSLLMKKQLRDVEKNRKATSKPAHKNKRFDKKVIV